MQVKTGGTVAIVLLAFALAGCVGTETQLEAAQPASAASMPVNPGLRIEARDCIQGGGNSVYGMEDGKTMIGPFYAQDQNPEVGNPMIGAFGSLVTGPSNGIWHVATVCQTYTYLGKEGTDFGMGWVAQMIKRPEFDTWGEPRIQFFVADLSFNVGSFVDAAHQATQGAEISRSTETTIELLPAEKYMHVVITEARHGTFEFTAELHKEFANKQTEHIRFWMLVPTDGQPHDHLATMQESAEPGYVPVSIDVYDTLRGPAQAKLAGESIGTFTHLPDGHVGNPLGHYQRGFDRVIEVGPMPDGVVFDTTWLH